MLRTASHEPSDLVSPPAKGASVTPTAGPSVPAPEATASSAALTAEEAALATLLSPVLAHGVRRTPGPEAVKRHVRLSAEPEDAIPAPPMPSETDVVLPPPLPEAGALDDQGFDDEGLNGQRVNRPGTFLSTLARSTAKPAATVAPPWLAKRRLRSRRAQAATVRAWLVMLLVIASLLTGAALGLLGVERVAATLVEAAETSGAAAAWVWDHVPSL